MSKASKESGMTEIDIEDIFSCIERMKVVGEPPSWIEMPRRVYARMFVGIKGGNAHQRRIQRRRLERVARWR